MSAEFVPAELTTVWFFDTNIILYLLEEGEKAEIATGLLQKRGVISGIHRLAHSSDIVSQRRGSINMGDKNGFDAMVFIGLMKMAYISAVPNV